MDASAEMHPIRMRRRNNITRTVLSLVVTIIS